MAIQAIREEEKVLLAAMRQPDKVLHFLRPGRLVRIREGDSVDWGWGILCCVNRRAGGSNGAAVDPADSYLLDVLLPCAGGTVAGTAGGLSRLCC